MSHHYCAVTVGHFHAGKNRQGDGGGEGAGVFSPELPLMRREGERLPVGCNAGGAARAFLHSQRLPEGIQPELGQPPRPIGGALVWILNVPSRSMF